MLYQRIELYDIFQVIPQCSSKFINCIKDKKSDVLAKNFPIIATFISFYTTFKYQDII